MSTSALADKGPGGKGAGDVMVCPELLEYVSKEVERDASAMKHVRKAREEHPFGEKFWILAS